MSAPFERTELADAPAYIPSPTAELIIAACAEGPPGELRVLILSGARGDGKTTSMVMAVIELAERMRRDGYGHVLPIRVACLRDTWVSLRRTTLATIEELQRKGLPVEWRDGQHEAVIAFDQPYVHLFFLGLENQADFDKLQGFQCAVFWIEEPAPAAGLSSGIPDIALGLGVTCLRQPGVPFYRLLISMNPPDRDHWVLSVEERLKDLGLSHVLVHHAKMGPGEKAEHFRALADEATTAEEAAEWRLAAEEFERYRERGRVFLESVGRKDLATRLIGGEIGDVQVGEPVVPMFSEEHVYKGELPVYRGLPIIRCWDNEPAPAVCLFQVLPDDGGINVLGSHCIENSTVQTLIETWLLPFMREHQLLTRISTPSYTRGARAGFTYQDVADRTLLDTQLSAGESIRAIGGSLVAGPVEWDERRAAALAAFSRVTRKGRRFVLIEEQTNQMLIQGLKNRYRYPKDIATGRIVMTIEAAKRVSGVFSNCPDALFYGLAWKFPAAEWLRRHQRQRVPGGPARRQGTFMGA